MKTVDQDSDRVDVSKADTKIIHEQGELTGKMAPRVMIGVCMVFCEFQRSWDSAAMPIYEGHKRLNIGIKCKKNHLLEVERLAICKGVVELVNQDSLDRITGISSSVVQRKFWGSVTYLDDISGVPEALWEDLRTGNDMGYKSDLGICDVIGGWESSYLRLKKTEFYFWWC